MPRPKRAYKDSLFRDIFNNKKRLKSLYYALTGETVREKDIKRTTLQGTFFGNIKNDISFRVKNRHIVLLEHQSTVNENMPLRMLWYVARLLQKEVNMDDIYHKTQIKLPTPLFFVFYNGTEQMPDKWEIRLSDAFEDKSGLELVVTAYNINYFANRDILNICHDLKCYSFFVEHARKLRASGKTKEEAIKETIRYMIENDMLADYFVEREQEEVLDMVSIYWDEDVARRVWQEDTREEIRKELIREVTNEVRNKVRNEVRNEFKERETNLKQEFKEKETNLRQELENEFEAKHTESLAQKTKQFILNMLKKHYAYETIAELAETTLDNVKKIAKEKGLAYSS